MKKIYTLITLIAIVNIASIKGQTDYKDVAHIFYSHCTTCHHEGQHAPSMMNYSQVLPLTWSIQNALQIGRMPPWSPDTSYTRFVHERVITQSEKDAVINWINGGAIKGDTTLAPPPPQYSQYKLNGIPTMTLQIPTYTSTATSNDIYVCFSIPSGLTQDRVLRAFEIIPGNPEIVHHVIVNADTAGNTSTDLSGTCFNPPGNFGIGGYAPGSAPTVFPGIAPLKTGIMIKAGSKIVIQMHYPAGSVGQIDSTKIRMYFYPANETGIRPIYNSTPLQNWGLSIPANNVSTFTDTYPNSGGLPVPISIFSAFPHSHKICSSIVNYAYLGTDTIPLIKINNWDFNWQGFYTYPNLVEIPAGYKLFSKHVFDNTVNNPNNPNSPPTHVIAGTSTGDEMLFDAFMWLTYQAGDETIDVAALLANDPLLAPLTVNVNEPLSAAITQAFIYPNPASGKVNIYLSKKSEYKVQITTITGQQISQTALFTDDTTLDIKAIPAGAYMVEITDIKTNHKITKRIIIN
ncbi:MAG: T9SS type A sorting domain-containing protein [Bacteroidota bacterium]